MVCWLLPLCAHAGVMEHAIYVRKGTFSHVKIIAVLCSKFSWRNVTWLTKTACMIFSGCLSILNCIFSSLRLYLYTYCIEHFPKAPVSGSHSWNHSVARFQLPKLLTLLPTTVSFWETEHFALRCHTGCVCYTLWLCTTLLHYFQTRYLQRHKKHQYRIIRVSRSI